ncbi:MAG: PTS sugar transporter subunit IIA [Nitrospina sp.]|jgi:PTS system nitrogen regulatory IIA component|nr:PTS sugar transporter subunit IIA [Nitrospina sp.]MBT6718370.1 PTS sugar transporter subunit IIA [Nitrospina sp.]
MKIDEILKKESVIADLIGQNKLEIIKEMTECLKKNNIIKDDQALFETLMEREKLGSTGIGENVAIPHGKSEELTQIITVFARSLKGVDFESLDQKPVHFVCMVIAPAHSTGQHLKALARISRLFKNQGLRDGILKAQDSSAIYSILLEEDSKFI